MEKGQMASSSSGPTAPGPLPSAPPSYEEAVGLTPGATIPGMPGMPMPVPVPMPQTVPRAPPYPVAGGHMPMPTPYAAPTAQIPQPSQHLTNQGQPPEVRVVHQHVIHTLGPNPEKMTCPSCHVDIKTTTMSDHQPSAHVCCIVLCLLGCCLCSCLPYCLSAFLSVHHFCPNCKAYIGTWKG